MTAYNRQHLAAALRDGTDPADIAGRGTGRTTANILLTLGKAISNPGRKLTLPRHLGEPSTKATATWLATNATDIVTALRLGGFRIEVVPVHTDGTYSVVVTNNFAVEL